MEIERKWEIGGFPQQLPLLEQVRMRQGYLVTEPVVRIRSEERADGCSYILCIKGKGTLVREEIETPISEEVFARIAGMLPAPLIETLPYSPPGMVLEKEYRAYRLADGHRLEVSLVDKDQPGGFFYAEVEFATEQEARAFVPPDFLGKELTELPGSSMSDYWNRRLARFQRG